MENKSAPPTSVAFEETRWKKRGKKGERGDLRLPREEEASKSLQIHAAFRSLGLPPLPPFLIVGRWILLFFPESSFGWGVRGGMANRMKEDERNEKIIRGLLKLPANRRCINCNSLGPQYVCTNFWTFICTNCSGIHIGCKDDDDECLKRRANNIIHKPVIIRLIIFFTFLPLFIFMRFLKYCSREFTHRVKSVSMAKFTSQEVNALQEGGNEVLKHVVLEQLLLMRAKEVYFKEWDAQRHSFPDSSNVDRLRDFIKHVYVDRRYSGERSIDRPSRVKKEDSYDNRKPDAYGGGSRSPSYEETYDRRYGERPGSGGRNDDRNFRSSYEERRSPGYDQGDYRRSPGRFDAVDERRRFPDGVPRPEGRPVINQKEPEISSPPMIRPVREIIGEDAPPLRVGEPPRANGTRVADAPAQALRTTSSSSLASTDSNPVELKRVNSGSLIDFDANPEPSVVAAPPPLQPVPQPTNFPVNGGNWASFDSVPPQKAQQPAANLNTVESALAELSVNPAGSSPSTFSNPHVDLFSLTSDVGQGPVNQQNQRSLFQATPNQSSVMHSSVPPFNPPPVVAPTSQASFREQYFSLHIVSI
ncbi:hypothetical protein Taro_022070 [Colocasia esculenta]|uniref:Arf-GAP domain-containing protein n=1 Tax=Colocasia esculenta TaxID=4460 RepID=A0A843V6W9_COLES|nr:hypothetical protein [Colocasia esculenta]